MYTFSQIFSKQILPCPQEFIIHKYFEIVIQHKVWATPDKLQHTTHALRVGKVVADAFQEEFDINYHLPKLGNTKD